jgi:hypothetical protein
VPPPHPRSPAPGPGRRVLVELVCALCAPGAASRDTADACRPATATVWCQVATTTRSSPHRGVGQTGHMPGMPFLCGAHLSPPISVGLFVRYRHEKPHGNGNRQRGHAQGADTRRARTRAGHGHAQGAGTRGARMPRGGKITGGGLRRAATGARHALPVGGPCAVAMPCRHSVPRWLVGSGSDVAPGQDRLTSTC